MQYVFNAKGSGWNREYAYWTFYQVSVLALSKLIKMNIVITYRLPKLIEIVIAYLFECLLCVNQYCNILQLVDSFNHGSK